MIDLLPLLKGIRLEVQSQAVNNRRVYGRHTYRSQDLAMIESTCIQRHASISRITAVLLAFVFLDALRASDENEKPNSSDSKSVDPYVLQDGETLKRVFPISREARLPYFKKMNFPDAQLDRRDNLTLTFSFDKDEPSLNRIFHGDSHTLSSIIEATSGVQPCELDGNRTLWALRIPGDFVFRKKATLEQTLDALQKILADDLKLEVRFTLENLDRIVYVASGEFEVRDDLLFEKGLILICGENRKSFQSQGGKFEEFLGAVSYRIGRRIVSELKEPPKKGVGWSIAIDGSPEDFWKEIPPNDKFTADADLVLENVSKQTGLVFKKTKRNVRIIRVERIAE
jgi:hypothetical protein